MEHHLVRNHDGTVDCTECGNSYDLHTTFDNILAKLADGERCNTCKKMLYNWTELVEK